MNVTRNTPKPTGRNQKLHLQLDFDDFEDLRSFIIEAFYLVCDPESDLNTQAALQNLAEGEGFGGGLSVSEIDKMLGVEPTEDPLEGLI